MFSEKITQDNTGLGHLKEGTRECENGKACATLVPGKLKNNIHRCLYFIKWFSTVMGGNSKFVSDLRNFERSFHFNFRRKSQSLFFICFSNVLYNTGKAGTAPDKSTVYCSCHGGHTNLF